MIKWIRECNVLILWVHSFKIMRCVHTNVGQEIKQRIINNDTTNGPKTYPKRTVFRLFLNYSPQHSRHDQQSWLYSPQVLMTILIKERKCNFFTFCSPPKDKIFHICLVMFTIAEIQTKNSETQLCIKLREVLTAL